MSVDRGIELREAGSYSLVQGTPNAQDAAKDMQVEQQRSACADLTFESIFGIEWPKMRKRVNSYMDSAYTQLFLVTLLLLSLYITDCWILGNEPDAGTIVLDGILTTVFVIFFIEVLILTLVEPGYYLSFFFYMDILGTLSIILDIKFMSESFLPSGTQASGSILRATRTAKLGARYGRLMRILKLIKFIQYIPCMAKKDTGDPEPTASSLRRVTYELSNVISQRVAALVMIIVIVVPFLSYPTDDHSATAWLTTLKMVTKNKEGNAGFTKAVLRDSVDRFENFYKHKDIKLYSVDVTSPESDMNLEEFWPSDRTVRSDNLLKFSLEYTPVSGGDKRYPISAVMDFTVPNQYDAACGVILVTMVIIILVSFSASFQTEVEVLVVNPLEKMLTTLRSSATVMLKSMNAIEKETGKQNEDEDEEDEGEMETLMLEKMVEKLTRIIKLTYPGANDLDLGDNVDSKTASWLQETYSTTKKRDDGHFDFLAMEEEDEIDILDDHDPIHEQEFLRQELVTKALTEAGLKDAHLLTGWDWDSLNYTTPELIMTLRYLFEVVNVFEEFHVPRDVFNEFALKVAGKYIYNEYHNFNHGMDVCYTVYRLLMDSKVHLVFSQLEMFAILTAALAHDVGHPGVNNVYLVKAKHPFALTHNDRSPLENMHCAVLYEILSHAPTNIFLSLSEDQWREARTIILTAILGTDMSHHYAQISKTQLFLEVNKDDVHAFCAGERDEINVLSEDKERHFILELCLHCADVSNPYKPYALCERWSKLVCEEFSLQGDREKSEGLEVSPMCDRNGINLPNMQMGFIEFVVAPLVITVIQLFYPLHVIGANMCQNYLEWGRKRREEIFSDNSIVDKEDECEKIDNRMKAFAEKFDFIQDLKALPLRPDISRARLFHRGQSHETQVKHPKTGLLTAKPSLTKAKKILGKSEE